MDLSSKDYRIIRSTHGRDEIRVGWTQGCCADAFYHTFEREMQFMCLVKCDFERTRNDLGAASQALRRRKDNRQILRLDAAISSDLRDDLCWWRLVAFDHQDGARSRVGLSHDV